jgi:outer membrane lipoprotein-sorting protein
MRLDLDVSRPPLSRFASARLWVGKNSLKPLRLSVSDVQGGGHDWVLRKMQAWTPGPTDFVWKSPKGAEVVDTRP